jgi:hypothetical protein
LDVADQGGELMKEEVAEFLARLDLPSPTAFAAADVESGAEASDLVTIVAELVAKSDEVVALRIGAVRLEIPISGIERIEEEPSQPAVSEGQSVQVKVRLSPSTPVVRHKKVTAAQLGRDVGIKPYVLQQPSQARQYAVPAQAAEQLEQARIANLGLAQATGAGRELGKYVTTSDSTQMGSPSSKTTATVDLVTNTSHPDTQAETVIDEITDYKSDFQAEA